MTERKSSCNVSSDRHSHYTLGMCCAQTKEVRVHGHFIASNVCVAARLLFRGAMPLRPPVRMTVLRSFSGEFIDAYGNSNYNNKNRRSSIYVH